MLHNLYCTFGHLFLVILMNKDEIILQLKNFSENVIDVVDSISYSTNDYIKEIVVHGAPCGATIVADVQEGGRGRLGRSWAEAAPGEGIAMSSYFHPNIPIEELPRVTLITALAVKDAIYQTTGINPDLKWPNDLLIGGKKVCGILTEKITPDADTGVVIGIGINVNQTEFPEEIKEKATSLRVVSGSEYSREPIIAGILSGIHERLRRLEREGWQGQKEEYESALVYPDGEIDSYGG